MQTIFATATAPLKSGVAIIRVSGNQAFNCLKALTGRGAITPRLATLAKLHNPQSNDLIDEAVVLWFPSPASFTGEDVAEFHIHGSRAVIDEMLEVLATMPDTRMAEPGEFSRRAFDNGKMDLTEAEGLADLIDAETKIQAKQALRQKQGILKDLYDQWRKQLISILANIEAYIDFPDEEIPDSVIDTVEKSVANLKFSITSHLSDNKRGEKLRNGLNAVIAGAPNVGKSSLLNHLAKRDVAIVSDIAGTTRDIIEVHLNLNGYPVILADTAGLRETDGVIEGEGIKRALARLEHADIKIIMFDAANIGDVDNNILSLIDDDTVIVVNKIDLAPSPKILDAIKHLPQIAISIKSGQGVDEFIRQLEHLARKHMEITTDPVITRDRHRNLLQETVNSLNRFSLKEELELAAENLRIAAVSLGRITGHIDVDEILDDIFSNFCIGK